MFKVLKKFNDNYSNVFFIISLIVIIVFLAYFAIMNANKPKECVMPDKLIGDFNNYSYKINYERDEDKYTLYVKKFENKYLFEVNHNDEKDTYYSHYFDLLKKNSDDIYIRYRDNYIIDGVDNKLLILSYVNDISYDSKRMENSDRTCYINSKNNLTMCINLDKSIELSKDDYKLTYEIVELGNVDDFNVRFDLEAYETVENSEIK